MSDFSVLNADRGQIVSLYSWKCSYVRGILRTVEL
ncbi:hypothetical protein ANCCAN_07914 [Ancylostoma caninum]|uniref:Uncharacterized protein n=1 Tax=Ancylostoma caninum TaxID=29170 RepID=A0A368GR25_ANCCA|nr:hypothetical protein ANCCAN_07914 [Ancylostoma caninum]